jgi:hypothetical protein
MKQVVGGAFSGYLNASLEQEVIDELIKQSQNYREDPRKRGSYNIRQLEKAAECVVSKIHRLLDGRIRFYLDLIATRLFDPETKLRWSYSTNNCQSFCDSLADWATFGSLICPTAPQTRIDSNSDIMPLYLFSFVCRPSSYTQAEVGTKFDVPNGLTEEYILKFRYGRHDDADIVDTLQEYWHDWGSFGGHLYKYQDLLPWDCTEAYGRYPVKCNDCNISKHVWSFPFDSWSIVQLHLQKDQLLYAPQQTPELNNDTQLSDRDWMHNRLTLLLAQDALISGAVAMALTDKFRQSCAWMQSDKSPRTDRLKLGGIHRAQPYSHHFERGQYHEYLIAEWAHLRRDAQIREYERLRDYRVALPDVHQSSGSSETDNVGRSPDWGFDFVVIDSMAFDYVPDGWDGCPASDAAATHEAGANDDGGVHNADGDGHHGDGGGHHGDSGGDHGGHDGGDHAGCGAAGCGSGCGSGCGGGCGGGCG